MNSPFYATAVRPIRHHVGRPSWTLPTNRFRCGRRGIHLLLFVHHRGVVRLPFSISTLERASCRLSVLRDHAAA